MDNNIYEQIQILKELLEEKTILNFDNKGHVIKPIDNTDKIYYHLGKLIALAEVENIKRRRNV